MSTLLSEVQEGEDIISQYDMIEVPAGEFVMGSDEGEAEGPAHTVFVDAFWMDTTPVTNRQFSQFIREAGHITTAAASRRQDWTMHAGLGREEHPVVLISWSDAEAYARWANKRLPTEAEWEKAARGGQTGKAFPWGDDLPSEKLVNWNRTYHDGEALPTSAVRRRLPNGFGLYDMVGNVWEWCHDWYDDNTYCAGDRRNSSGPVTGTYRVRRGASWNVREDFRLRCANRGAMPPESYHPNLGFRCARSQGENGWKETPR